MSTKSRSLPDVSPQRWVLSVVALVVAAAVTAGQAHADPNALWTIVHDQCVPDQQASDNPAPCSLVDLGAGEDRGYAVLKDLVGATQFLLIPTERITGIESPTLLQPDTPNYFGPAWRARTFVDARAGVELPRDWISLAVNSEMARTQDQLHIHIDCVRADVREALSRHIADIGPNWAPFPEPLSGHPYQAMTVEGDDLGADPFTLLANRTSDMGRETLVVAGTYLSDGRPGFVVLAGQADPAAGIPGSGEELQDHSTCPPPRGQWSK